MKKILEKIRIWWYLHIANPVVRKGETQDGAFKWVFRRFWLEISTFSGNFKARFTAAEHPMGYLSLGNDEQVCGFAQRLYMVAMLLTTEQKFVNDIDKAIESYNKRMQKKADVKEDDIEEKIALETEKAIQEHIELPAKERKKVERGIDGRFKKAVAQNLEKSE